MNSQAVLQCVTTSDLGPLVKDLGKRLGTLFA